MALPTNWHVLLGEGNSQIEISNKVIDISNISADLDIERPTEFNTSDARMFVRKPYPANLVNKEFVLIRAGSKIVYSGKILSIHKDLKTHQADVIISDISQDMRDQTLDNFGISKRVRVSKVGDTESGEYPFTNNLSPVSDKSLINPRVGSSFYNSGIQGAPNDADNDDPIDFGSVGISEVDRVSWGDGYIYEVRGEDLSGIRIRVEGDVNLNTVISCRYSAILPTESGLLTPTNLTSHGTQLFRGNTSDMSFGIEGVIDSPGRGLYFWIYPDTDIEVSNRRLILDFGSNALKPLNVVDFFLTEGKLEPTNISYDEDTLRSEGEALDDDPDVTIKAPYRNKTILYIIKKILDFYGVNNSYVSIDLLNTEEDHFSTYGRVGYDLESNLDENKPLAQGADTALFWTGSVTDFLVDDNKFYFLYSSRTGLPRIIEYSPLTDIYREVYKRDTHAEWWKFVKSGNTFYILGTTISSVDVANPTLGAYDPTEANPGTFIEILSGTTLSTYIESNYAFRPVVGMYYQFGFSPDGFNDNVRQGIQPDTRKSFILHNSNLYYIYAGNTTCGIARATAQNTATAFVQIAKDGLFNHLGLDFTIDNNILYGAATFQKGTEGSRIIFKKAL